MANYYVNKDAQLTGEHEVHTSSCSKLPSEVNKKYLGSFTDCKDAVKEAENYYDNVDGCYHCSEKCHTR